MRGHNRKRSPVSRGIGVSLYAHGALGDCPLPRERAGICLTQRRRDAENAEICYAGRPVVGPYHASLATVPAAGC